MLCKNCNEREIAYKKAELCAKCYNNKRNEAKRRGKLRHSSEIEFIKNFYNHNNWYHEPITFRLDDTTYTPDFYEPERNVFIEVIGSRQAYHENKHKYKKLAKKYPFVKLEFRCADGEKVELSDKKIKWMMGKPKPLKDR